MNGTKHSVFEIKADERGSEAWNFAEGSLYKDRTLQQAWGELEAPRLSLCGDARWSDCWFKASWEPIN